MKPPHLTLTRGRGRFQQGQGRSGVGCKTLIWRPIHPRGGPTGKGPTRMTMPSFTMRQLLEAGVHFGHHTRRWNPKMEPYLFGVRNGVHVIDLEQTVPLLARALEAVRQTTASGGRLLVGGTQRQAPEAVARRAPR